MAAIGWSGVVYAANNSVQGAKKEDAGFDGDAPRPCPQCKPAMAMSQCKSEQTARRSRGPARARQAGPEVSERGRISAEVMSQYEAAH